MTSEESDAFDVEQLISQLRSVRGSDNFTDEGQRQRLREALGVATIRVEQPRETVYRIASTQPSLAAVLKVCNDAHLFEKWATLERNQGRSFTSAELARETNIDKDLLDRMLRHLTALHVIEQNDTNGYSLSEFSRGLARRDVNCMIDFMYNTTLPGYLNLPTFLSSINYGDPKKSNQNNWIHFRGVPRFEDLTKKPEELATFQTVMATNVATKTPWTEIFSPQNLLDIRRDHPSPEAVLFIDVGGGAGYDSERLWTWLQNHSSAENMSQQLDKALILQDLPEQVARASVSSSIRKMPHDFFTAQPVKGAAAYYLHTVLHDWPDEKAIAILKHLADAAVPKVSRVLIHETVVSTSPSALSTSLDIHMMMVNGSFERTEEEWRRIVAAAGLEIVKIWSKPGTVESVIEAVRNVET